MFCIKGGGNIVAKACNPNIQVRSPRSRGQNALMAMPLMAQTTNVNASKITTNFSLTKDLTQNSPLKVTSMILCQVSGLI